MSLSSFKTCAKATLTLLTLLAILPLNGHAEREITKLKPTTKMVGETKWVTQALQRYHYLNQSVDDIDFKEFVRTFMERFDGFHMYFLDTDREDFEIRLGLNMPTYLSDGNLYPAYKIFERFQKRSFERIDWVFERLDKPFEFTSDETYEPDRKEAEWPKDKAAADKLWEARLTYEILNEVLSEEASDEKGDGERESTEKKQSVSGGPSKEVLEEAVKTIRRRFERWEKTLG